MARRNSYFAHPELGKKTLKILLADDTRSLSWFARSPSDHEGWEISGEAVDGRDAVDQSSAPETRGWSFWTSECHV